MDPMLGVSYMPKPPRKTVLSSENGRYAKPNRGTTRVGAVRRPCGKCAWLASSTGVHGAPLTAGPAVLLYCGQASNDAKNPGASVLSAPSGYTTRPDFATLGSKLPIFPNSSV